jgi:carbon-monoxide dehydrogenase small subunit
MPETADRAVSRRRSDLELSCTVNGEPVTLDVTPFVTLLDVLRDRLELTGTKYGCGEGECGACSVLLNGRVVNSCLVLAAECEGAEITTIEGLANDGRLHPIQQAFVDRGAVQCGFCTPGMIMAALSLLNTNPHPTEDEVKRALEGNLCRCTGYRKIIDAVLSLADGGGSHV